MASSSPFKTHLSCNVFNWLLIAFSLSRHTKHCAMLKVNYAHRDKTAGIQRCWAISFIFRWLNCMLNTNLCGVQCIRITCTPASAWMTPSPNPMFTAALSAPKGMYFFIHYSSSWGTSKNAAFMASKTPWIKLKKKSKMWDLCRDCSHCEAKL